MSHDHEPTPRRRATDTNLLDRVSHQIGRYRVFVYAVFGFLVMLGFDFKTPASHFRTLEAETIKLRHTDTTLMLRIDSVQIDHIEIGRYIQALAVAQCLDRPRRDTELMGLDCEAIRRRAAGPLPRRDQLVR